jgi:MYXO-CTERM domain-containing protein
VFPVSDPLDEDLVYEWSATAVDARGTSSLPSDRVWFDVDALNTPPAPPSFQQLGDEVSTQNPVLAALVGEDADGDAQVVRFQIDSQQDFASLDSQQLVTENVGADGIGQVVVPNALPENVMAWARARGEDERGAVSEWVTTSFFVNSLEEPPEGVVVIEPGDGQTVSSGDVVLRWAPALDVDQDELTYTLQITRDDETAEVVFEESGLLIAASVGSLPEGQHLAGLELDAGGYLVSARAVDDTGLEGPWGPGNSFAVLATPGDGIDLEDFGAGCSCSSGALQSTPGALLWFALLTGLMPLRRRRS